MMDSARPVRVPLSDLAVLRFEGADAVPFLQGQLTNDVASLPPTKACLAAWCSAKGRVLATLVVWRAPGAPPAGENAPGDTCYALVQADVAGALVKRLSMFVLRAKVKIAVAVDVRVSGDMATAPAGEAWDVVRTDGVIRIQAPTSAGAPCRTWCIEGGDDAPGSAEAGGAADAASREAWHAADIAAGLAWIGAANQDMYIPQTLNLDLMGGISFTKGCYPGQEIVARSHYRGTLKRRMARASAITQTPAHVGMDIFKAGDVNPCGRVINRAHADGAEHVLMEVQRADLPDAEFCLGSAVGAALQLHALPYRV